MNVTIEKCGDELIAALAGEIDHHNSKQIREAIDAELERGGYKLLTFDLESVSFMDSSGIGIVLGRYKVVSKGGGRLRIINAQESRTHIAYGGYFFNCGISAKESLNHEEHCKIRIFEPVGKRGTCAFGCSGVHYAA